MRILLIITSILISSQALAINYFRCDSTNDCTKAYGGCGRYFSVHKRYKELYEAKAHKSDTVAFCLKPRDIDNQYKHEGEPLCKKNRCLLTLKNNKKSSQIK